MEKSKMSRAEEEARKIYPYETGMKGLICENSRGIYIQGYEQAEKNLGWHSVDESLPPVDEEVIVLTNIIAEDSIKIGFGRICFAHIVNPHLTVDIDGKPYKAVSHNGWNIPGVKYWMPMPILPEEEEK